MRGFICLGFGMALLCVSCSSPESKPTTDTTLISGAPRHPVTEKMSGVTSKLTTSKVANFGGNDLSGKRIELDSVLDKGPAIVYSIKEGCPCSTDFEPFANSFSNRYRDRVTVLGIYNESTSAGKKWAEQHSSDHPIISDPSLKIVKQLKQERSVYVTLIDQRRQIVKSWAGYSKSMLLELDKLIQEQVIVSIPAFDTAYAPVAQASGCQLFQGEGFAEGDLP